MSFLKTIFNSFWSNQSLDSSLINELELTSLELKIDKIENQRKKLLRYLKNEENVDILIKLWYELSPKEYEYFISYIFSKIWWYKTFVTWWFDDWWIDIKWAKLVNWKLEYIAVQCKRWNIFNIKQKHIKEFYWSVADIKYRHNVKIYFATTNYLTQNARRYTDEHDIFYLDYTSMIEAYKMINWDDFLLYLKENNNDKNCINDAHFTRKTRQKTKTVKDLYSLLKEIRNRLANKEWLPKHCIFPDNTLKEIAEKRPQNKYEALKIRWIWELKFQKYFTQFSEILKD